MRLVIDMQGAQSIGNRDRGIGRYTLALAKELARQRGEHEVLLVLNGAFPEIVKTIRAEFANLLPKEAIHVWWPARPCRNLEPTNDERRLASEILIEAFVASLKPDVVLVSSLFEGLVDDTAISLDRLGKRVPTAVILYDLIPLIHSEIYLKSPEVALWYERRLDHLRRADLLLSISASSGQEAVDYLSFPKELVVNIGTACNDQFRPIALNDKARQALGLRYGLNRKFVMYTGGIDHRKNIEGLIRAYAQLPRSIRDIHQLAVVCSIQAIDRDRLDLIANDAGLAKDEIVMTGFVPDDDLLSLYNACELFVFPSWHEGFGLPALEAMACGCPTIGANTSSLPEVIGLEAAQFNPRSVESISALMRKALTNTSFRKLLTRHAVTQSKKFSWQSTATLAWSALTQLAAQASGRTSSRALSTRPRLAMISPIREAKSGIADYVAELLPELSRYYEISIVVDQSELVTDKWILSNCPVYSVEWFKVNYQFFDRVLYQFGNSHYHSHMFDLLRDFPGTVVLHDFFLSGVVAHKDITGDKPGEWARALLADHGWLAVKERFEAKDTADVVWAYPCNGDILRRARGVIVHAPHSIDLAKTWYCNNTGSNWRTIPLLRVPAVLPSADAWARARADARQTLGIAEGDFVICSFGHLGRTKLNDRLLASWTLAGFGQRPECQLVFAGQNEGGDYGQQLERRIANTPGRVRITGFLDTDEYRRWLLAADVAVQLRANSRGETSAAVLDCWNYGLATIVNAHGSLADLPGDCVVKLPDPFTDEQLASALCDLHENLELRLSIGENARTRLLSHHNPRQCADMYRDAIEDQYTLPGSGSEDTVPQLATIASGLSHDDLAIVSNSISRTFPPSPRKAQWLIDVSELVQRDSKSGIQRVVRAILNQLMTNPPHNTVIRPVYATIGDSFRYANKFTCEFLGISQHWCEDHLIEAWSGDIFLALDLQPNILPQRIQQILELQASGVKVLGVVYDLLPLLLQDTFVEGASDSHQKWLNAIQQMDGAMCISQSVADELTIWLDANGDKTRVLPFDIDYFHLGADIEESFPIRGRPESGDKPIFNMKEVPTFLVVGTVEPRKGHSLLLDAFEELWSKGRQYNLVIVGKQGWLVDELVHRLHTHPENGRYLYWLERASDEFLDELYGSAACLLAPSKGEGFGLPLVEAARRGLKIIARDIPVFREVAGGGATFFPAKASGKELAQVIDEWIVEHGSKAESRSTGTPWISWSQSADQVKDILLGKRGPYRRWLPPKPHIYWGSDQRLLTRVGRREGFAMLTTGQAGTLILGPYLSVESGAYRVTVKGEASNWSGSEVLEVACSRGEVILAKRLLDGPPDIWDITLDFEVKSSVDDLEVRLSVCSGSDLSVDEIRIEPLSA